MDRIKRTSVDIKNFKSLDLVGSDPEQNLDLQLQTIQRIEHIVLSLQHIIRLLSETSLSYETQRYEEPLNNLMAVHNVLRKQYPASLPKHANLLAECVNRMTQYTSLAPLAFFREKSGQAVHALQTIESRRKILGFAKTLKDRSETILEIAGVPLP